MKKAIIICGLTATGKTSLAIKIAKKINADILSADSRQVYKNMDIGTGKDIPAHSKRLTSQKKFKGKNITYYQMGGVRIWGYDIIKPHQSFSIADFQTYSRIVYSEIEKTNRFPIIVGGSGLYINAALQLIQTASIPMNNKLRKRLKNKTAPNLFKILLMINPAKAKSLNASDKKNPARLIRAIEISKHSKSVYPKKDKKHFNNVLWIGLTADKQTINKLINLRVNNRLKKGFETEVSSLLAQGVTWRDQSFNTLGYKQYRNYYLNNTNKENFIQDWIKQETKYAKRQKTWFNKQKGINWYDVSEKSSISQVEKKILKWYSKII